MERKHEESLKNWKERKTRHPLILRGARQAGKTYLVREFARKCFKHFIEVNFEEDASFVKLFGSKNPDVICELLNSRFSVPVKDVETLVFLDELQAAGKTGLKDFVGRYSVGDDMPEALHKELSLWLRRYLVVGGMPAAVKAYIESGLDEAQRVVTRVRLLPVDPFPNLKRIGSVKCRVLMIHGTCDRVIPYSQGEALFKLANEPKRFVSVEDGDHNTLVYDMGFGNYYYLIKEFADGAGVEPRQPDMNGGE